MRPGMSDGRMFTDYRPSSVVNEMIQEKAEIDTTGEYRNYLQNVEITELKNKIVITKNDNVVKNGVHS